MNRQERGQLVRAFQERHGGFARTSCPRSFRYGSWEGPGWGVVRGKRLHRGKVGPDCWRPSVPVWECSTVLHPSPSIPLPI